MASDDLLDGALDNELPSEDDGSLDVDPLTALRLRHDLDRFYRDSADMANDRPQRSKGTKRKERRGVTYSTKAMAEPDWQRDKGKLPLRPPVAKRAGTETTRDD